VEAFAEVGDYFDQPVRTYSSGMHVRLAFACATAARPEVLLVDEALAVGDAYFQSKCFARLREFRAAGTSLLFVSHDASAVRSLCDRALLLDRGAPVLTGPPDEVLDVYNATIARREADAAIRREETERGVPTVRSGNARIVLETVDLLDHGGRSCRAFLQGEPVRLRVALRSAEPLPFPTVGFIVRDPKGNDVYGTNTHHLKLAGPGLAAGESAACDFDFPADLGPGAYTVTAALHTGDSHVECNYDWWDKVIAFEVVHGGRGAFAIGTARLQVAAAVRPLAGGDPP
jgi:lipopolysaccharide transport system ATP-binding protein